MDYIITPEAVLALSARERGVKVSDLALPPVAVLSWRPSIVRALAAATGAVPHPHWLHDGYSPLYVGRRGRREFCFTLVPVGAPATAVFLEDVIACGCRCVIGVGWAGSLQPTAPVGTLFLPTACISDEGTSRHYVDGEAPVGPSGRLARILERCCRAEGVAPALGTVWTTDALYRERRDRADLYRGRGVVGIDMETAAMYAIGRHRGVDVCNLLVISDEAWGSWTPAFRSERLNRAEERAVRVVVRCLAARGLVPPRPGRAGNG